MRRVLAGGLIALALAALAVAIAFRTPWIAAPQGADTAQQAPQPTHSRDDRRSRPIRRQSPVAYSGLICFDCHDSAKLDSAQGGVSYSHSRHRGRGAHCNACHGDCPEVEMGRSGHDQCSWCHNGRKASDRCTSCHVQPEDIRPTDHDQGHIRGHGQRIRTTGQGVRCRKCHDDSWCDECHGLPMPHPAGYSHQHASLGAASFADDSVCMKCHSRESFCGTCHGPGERQE